MADSHTGDADEKESTTKQNSKATASASRRTLLKGIGAFATVGGTGAIASEAVSASGHFGDFSSPNGEVTIPAGEYTWNDDDLDIGSGDALIGGGSAGDVVVNLEDGTMDGSISGRLENIVVRGNNGDSKAGIDVEDGAVIDGFHWPEGGQQDEDRCFFSPSGGDRATIRNSSWAWMVNNGAYTDKMPMTFENCASINNNIAGIRIGQEDSDTSAVTYIRNCLIAVTEQPEYDDTNVPNARGIRMRERGTFVIENCYFVYLDVDGAADLIEIHDGAGKSDVTIRNCAFYNDSSRDLVRDKGNGMADVTIEDCSFHGSGSSNIEPDYDGNGLVEKEVNFPLPSEITGYAVADEAEGVGAGIGPWSGSATSSDDTTDEEEQTADPAEYDHTLVLEASEDNPVSADATPGDFDLDIFFSGDATYGDLAEPDEDQISTAEDGTTKVDVSNLMPGELDSYRFNGEVVDYAVDDGYEYSVSMDGTTTTFEELVNGEGPTADDESSSDSTDSGSTDDGSSTDSSSTDDSSTTDGDRTYDDDMTSRVVVDGADNGRPTNYTFTVSGDVVRDTDTSTRTADGTDWDRVEDFARDGKVIGVVGSGVDAYQFSGSLTGVTVDGEATLTIERGA